MLIGVDCKESILKRYAKELKHKGTYRIFPVKESIGMSCVSLAPSAGLTWWTRCLVPGMIECIAVLAMAQSVLGVEMCSVKVVLYG